MTARITTADWIANVLDAEDRAIRKRTGLPECPGYAYAIEQRAAGRIESDFERGMRLYRAGMLSRGGEASVAAD